MNSLSPITISLIDACQSFRNRIPLWTQGVGGNLSCKEGDTLWIKASGVRLDQVQMSCAIAKVRWKDVRSGLLQKFLREEEAEQYYADLLSLSSEKSPAMGRPSMETGFHAQMDSRWVAHFHSLPAILMGHEEKKQPEEIAKWLRQNCPFSVGFLPPTRPGWFLSLGLGNVAIHDFIVLANHGLIARSDSPLRPGEGALKAWEWIERKFCEDFGYGEIYQLNKGDALRPGPIKFYFPDVAVFLMRLKKQLSQKTNSFYQLNEQAWDHDRDIAELWTAVQWLYSVCPELDELPQQMSDSVANLPLELFRLKVGQ